MINVLSPEERAEFVEQLSNKQDEILNKNVIECREKKLNIFRELFQMYLSDKGRLLLREPGRDRLRNILINKIIEISEDDVAQQDMEYMTCANELKIFVENIVQGVNILYEEARENIPVQI